MSAGWFQLIAPDGVFQVLSLEECVPIEIMAGQSLPDPHTWSKYNILMMRWRYVLKGMAQNHTFSTDFRDEFNCSQLLGIAGCRT